MCLFEHYPATPGSINGVAGRAGAAASGVSALAGDVGSHSQVTSSAVTGTLVAPLVAAPVPVVSTSQSICAAAIVAQGCLNRWSSTVSAYNTAIDELNARYQSARANGFGVDAGQFLGTSEGTPAQRQGAYDSAVTSAEASLCGTLRAEKADLDRRLDDDADTVAAMLDEGPTQEVAVALTAGGDLPPGSAGLAGHLWNALTGQFRPPPGGGPWDIGLWALGRGGAGLGVGINVARYAQYGRFAPRGVDGRYVRIPSSRVSQGVMAMSQRNWQARPHTSAIRGQWGTVGTAAKWGGVGLAGVGGGLNQWSQDANRTDLSTTDRVARAGTRGALTAGGAWAGGALGGKVGAGVGFAIGGPPGAAVGAIVGGIVGGVIGSGVANEVADHAVELADDAVDLAGEAVDEVKDAAGAVGDFFGF